jgi:hypothetical protein
MESSASKHLSVFVSFRSTSPPFFFFASLCTFETPCEGIERAQGSSFWAVREKSLVSLNTECLPSTSTCVVRLLKKELPSQPSQLFFSDMPRTFPCLTSTLLLSLLLRFFKCLSSCPPSHTHTHTHKLTNRPDGERSSFYFEKINSINIDKKDTTNTLTHHYSIVAHSNTCTSASIELLPVSFFSPLF